MSELEFRCAVWMNEYGINVYSNCSSIGDLLKDKSFVHLIPGYRYNHERSNAGYSLRLHIGENYPFSVEVSDDRRTFAVQGTKQELSDGSTIPFLVHYALEPQRLRDGQITMRGAAISKNGRGVLLLGNSGAGKTSVCVELCKKHSYSLIGNNVVLLGIESQQGFLYGGEKVLRFRLATLKRYNTDLKWIFGKIESDADEWTTTASALPSKIGIPLEQQKRVPIETILFLHLVDDEDKPLHIEPVEPLFGSCFYTKGCQSSLGESARPFLWEEIFVMVVIFRRLIVLSFTVEEWR